MDTTGAEKRRRCPVCGKGQLLPRIQDERYEYEENGAPVTIVVENVPVETCDVCGETVSGPEANRLHHEAICRTFGLLTPKEIRALRERLGLTPAELARLTGIEEATITQWERSRLIQDRGMDRYLRLLDMRPEILKLLEELAGRAAAARNLPANGSAGSAESAPLTPAQTSTGDTGSSR
jgi:HTH-type transcriptional regulator/antitoxin MqsA